MALIIFFGTPAVSQELITHTIHLQNQHSQVIEQFNKTKRLIFEASSNNPENTQISFITTSINLGSGKSGKLTGFTPYYSKLSIRTPYLEGSQSTVNPVLFNAKGRDFNSAQISVLPGQWINSEEFRILDSLKLEIKIEPQINVRSGPPNFADESVLSTNTTYKIATSQAGIYEITAKVLSDLGINTATVNPTRIKIFTTMPGPLPHQNNLPRTDDLMEVAVRFSGSNSEKWTDGDVIQFYSPGPHRLERQADSTLTRITNIYEDKKYFFIQISNETGKRIQTVAQSPSSDYTTDKYLYYSRHEADLLNPLRDISKAGAGQIWFGETFQYDKRFFEFTSNFNSDQLISADTGFIRVGFAGRSAVESFLDLNCDASSNRIRISPVNITSINTIANYRNQTFNFVQTGNKPVISLRYNEVQTESIGWLDYLEVNLSKKLTKSTGALDFRLGKSPVSGQLLYSINGLAGNESVWDVTDLFNAKSFEIKNNGSNGSIIAPFPQSREFICFAPADVMTPEIIGNVVPQNIHGAETPDMVIVYHKDFEAEALDFADYRSKKSNISVLALDIDQIENEFSGGGQDPTAIRDMARMFYVRNPEKFKYILLYGSGSYDYKDITIKNKINSYNTNYVPVYENPSSPLDPTNSLASDDYFGLLDENEGPLSVGLIDVFVGRFPIKDRSEAILINNKIKSYELLKTSYGDWRNNVLLISDDYDGSSDSFVNQSETVTDTIIKYDPTTTISKIAMDVYKQEYTIGGQRYPDANNDMVDIFNKGVLVANYIGHGGVDGLADEKIIDRNTLLKLNNALRLPMFVTGTCSFSTYDDPALNSIGQLCLLRPNGGMVALMTTTRIVYIGPNAVFIQRLFREIYKKVNNRHQTIGQMLANTKNQDSGIDRLAYALLGDPSMYLNFPEYNVHLDEINGNPVNSQNPDTIKALEKVTIKGSVKDFSNEVIDDFNGTMILTVYDKPVTIYTRGNDGRGSNIPLSLQKNQIFKGQATVTGGLFEISFITPKDINYNVGAGKFSFYAYNEEIDANGFSEDFLVGGESDNPVKDDSPPVIELYLNDLSFKSGNTVNNTPILLAKLSDDTGINITGNSIGHDIQQILNNNASTAQVLNEFYLADKDSYNKGQVTYQFDKLENGQHTLNLTAWDLANNKSEATIDFIVTDDDENVITHVLNYPNPFTTSTAFMFEYNSQNSTIEAHVNIYSVSGKLVKSIVETLNPSGTRFQTSTWNGLDDYGDKLAKGVYLYKIKLINRQSSDSKVVTSEFQKFVLLR